MSQTTLSLSTPQHPCDKKIWSTYASTLLLILLFWYERNFYLQVINQKFNIVQPNSGRSTVPNNCFGSSFFSASNAIETSLVPISAQSYSWKGSSLFCEAIHAKNWPLSSTSSTESLFNKLTQHTSSMNTTAWTITNMSYLTPDLQYVRSFSVLTHIPDKYPR